MHTLSLETVSHNNVRVSSGKIKLYIFLLEWKIKLSFSRSCLKIRPKDRIELSEILNHPWLVESDEETKSLEEYFHQMMTLSTESL